MVAVLTVVTYSPYTTLFRSAAQERRVPLGAERLRVDVAHRDERRVARHRVGARPRGDLKAINAALARRERSEEQTSELQSRRDLECRLQLEKNNKTNNQQRK